MSSNLFIEGAARHNESLSEVRASPKGLARRGCSESEVKAAFPRLSASRIGCSKRDSTTSEQPLKHHVAILHSYIFIIVGIRRFRARGVDSGTRHQLLGR